MSTSVEIEKPRTFRSDVPARLERLPWSRWHWMVITALGITWIIDGLEVTMIASFSVVLQEPGTLHFRADEIGLLNTSYLAGAVLGALVFGYLTDRLGRKKLFSVTLGLYLMLGLAHGILVELRELRRVPLPHRCGDRRRILGDQFRHRRADPQPGPGLGRPGDQRHVLAGSRHGLAREHHLAESLHLPRESGLAAGFRHRRGTGTGDHLPATSRPGESPMALDPRPARRGRARGRRDRARDRRAHPMRKSSPRPKGRSPSGLADRSASASSRRSCCGLIPAAPCSAWP